MTAFLLVALLKLRHALKPWMVRGKDGASNVTDPHVDTSITILTRGPPSWLRQGGV